MTDPTNKPASPDLAERIAGQLYYELGPEDPRLPWVEVAATVIRESLAPVRTALEKAEWVYDPTPDKSRQWFCPACDNVKSYGHAEGCALAAAILLLRGERP